MDVSYQYLRFFLDDDEKLEKIRQVSFMVCTNTVMVNVGLFMLWFKSCFGSAVVSSCKSAFVFIQKSFIRYCIIEICRLVHSCC